MQICLVILYACTYSTHCIWFLIWFLIFSSYPLAPPIPGRGVNQFKSCWTKRGQHFQVGRSQRPKILPPSLCLRRDDASWHSSRPLYDVVRWCVEPSQFWKQKTYVLKGKFSQSTMWIGWVESNFRNPTVKVWADLDNPFKRSDYAKLCMSPSLDETRPEHVISQEDNSPLTLYIDFHYFQIVLDINSPVDPVHS